MLSALLICAFSHTPAAVELPPALAAPGSIFLSAREAENVRARCRNDDEARALRVALVTEADALVGEPLEIPHAGGQWTHWYSCKKDGGGLEAESPARHVCRECGEVYSGWPYDDVYVTHRHHHWLGGVETLGWAYTLEPNRVYAERARRILLEYASFYRDLPQHDTKGEASNRGGRLFAQTLDESVDLCRICAGYDRVYSDPCFRAEDHAQIVEGLLRPMVETIRTNDRGISNWQTWHNAGVLCAGLVIGDRGYVDWAINGKHGFLFQMREGSVVESGMWYEESPLYHWYALNAIMYTAEGAARSGIDLYSLPIVRKLFDAPIRQVFPDLTFPAMNDSSSSSIRAQRAFYAIAWKRYRDPRYAALAAPCDSPRALFWGEPLPSGRLPRLRLETSNEVCEGLAILRDKADQTAVFVDYGPGRSGHVQPAKLNLILYAHGTERFLDPGRLPYGNPLHQAWYRQTVAHNTVVVDGVSQRRAEGRLIAFRNMPAYALAHVAADDAYNGVALERVVVLAGSTILDLFRCRSDQSHTYDLPLHLRGDLERIARIEACGPLGDKDGYQILADTGKLQTDDREATLLTGNGRRIHLQFLDDAPVFRATGLGATPRERLPMLLRRQQGNEAVFAAVYTLLEPRQAPPICAFERGKRRLLLRAGNVVLRLGDHAHVRVHGAEHD